jgi:peptidoglycan/LPS O-acetylase OafA/YrhL
LNGQARIPELDGLRGIAIGLVLFYHYFFLTSHARLGSLLSRLLALGRLSWSGVDLFFVLSGFLIGGILLDARDSTNYYSTFYMRRFFRIVPIYMVCLAGFFALRAFIQAGHASDFLYMMKDQLPAWPYFTFLQNFWMAKTNSLGAFGLGATWSLAVEEQFYLTLPLLIRLLPRRRLPTFLAVTVFGALVLRTLLVLVWRDHSLSRFVLMPCRADTLLLGVLGALAVRDPKSYEWLAGNRKLLGILAGALALGIGVMTYVKAGQDGVMIQTGGLTWLAAFYLCILLLAVTGRSDWIKRFLRMKWLMWLGGIAYGTYLFHEFVLGAFFTFFRSHSIGLYNITDVLVAVAALASTLFLCKISWTYFEKPLIKIAHRTGYVFAATGLPETTGHLNPTSAGTS